MNAVALPPALSPAVADPARWVARYEPGVDAELPASDALMTDLVASAAASAPTFPALVCLGAGMSYAALHALSERVAAALVRDGLQHGQRVLIALPDCPESVAATLGVLRAGGVAVHGGRDDAAARRALAESCRFALVERGAAEDFKGAPAGVVVIDPARNLSPLVRLLVGLSRRSRASSRPRLPYGVAPWKAWLGGTLLDAPAPLPDAPAVQIGDVAFSHRHLVAAAAQLRAWLTDAVPGGETWLSLAPLGGNLGCVAVIGSAAALRARVVLLPAWQPEDVVDALRTYQPTWVVADAAAVARLVADPVFAWADMRSVRAWLVGGALPPDVALGFEEATGTRPCVGLVAPRAAGLLTCQPVNGRRAPGTLGLPVPGVEVTELPGARLALRSPTIAGDPAQDPIVVAGTLDPEGYVREVAKRP